MARRKPRPAASAFAPACVRRAGGATVRPRLAGLADTGKTGAGQCRGRQRAGDLALHGGQPRGIDAIDFGERHRAVRQAQQIDDGQVLAGLRHGAVVGCNHQQHVVDAGGPGQHVVHQAFVAGHVHKAWLSVGVW